MAVYTPTQLFTGDKTQAADLVLYTVPANTKTIVKQITVANITANPVAVWLKVAGGQILNDYKINGNSTVIIDLAQVMTPNQVISLGAPANTVQCNASGVVIT